MSRQGSERFGNLPKATQLQGTEKETRLAPEPKPFPQVPPDSGLTEAILHPPANRWQAQ